MAVET